MRPGFDLIAQGAAGVMSVTGEPGGNPVKAGVPVSDLSAGLFCTIGILSALHSRTTTGEGQHIDTSLWEGALALGIWETAELWVTGEAPQPLGSAHRLTAPYQALQTKDGHITVGGNNQKLWLRLCATIGRDDLPDDAALRHQRRPHGQPAGARRTSSSARWPTPHRALGRQAARRGRPRRPDPRLRPGRRRPPHPRT